MSNPNEVKKVPAYQPAFKLAVDDPKPAVDPLHDNVKKLEVPNDEVNDEVMVTWTELSKERGELICLPRLEISWDGIKFIKLGRTVCSHYKEPKEDRYYGVIVRDPARPDGYKLFDPKKTVHVRVAGGLLPMVLDVEISKLTVVDPILHFNEALILGIKRFK